MVDAKKKAILEKGQCYGWEIQRAGKSQEKVDVNERAHLWKLYIRESEIVTKKRAISRNISIPLIS